MVHVLSMSYPRIQGPQTSLKTPKRDERGGRGQNPYSYDVMRGSVQKQQVSQKQNYRTRKHVRRFNVTEDSLFVVLRGGNKASEGGNGSRMMGGDDEEGGDSESTALADHNFRQPCSVYLQNAGLHTK